jgi:hypothetical protein
VTSPTSERAESGRIMARDAALRRTRAAIAGIAAGAVALSGVLSVVAAQAFKGHPQRRAAAAARTRDARVRVPGPQSVPAIAGRPAPLRPPAQPPAAPAPQPAAPAPDPQVSGGS